MIVVLAEHNILLNRKINGKYFKFQVLFLTSGKQHTL